MSAPMPPLRRALWSAAGAALALALTALALRSMGPSGAALGSLLERVQPAPLLGAMLVMSAGMVFVALRWRALIPGGAQLPAVGLTGIVCAGLLLNYALPGPVGEVAAAAMVARRYGVPGPLALAGSVHGRLVGLSSAGVLAGLSYTFGELPVPPEYQGLVGLAALGIGAGAVALGVLSARPRWLSALSAATLGRLAGGPSALSRGCAGLDQLAQQVAQGLHQVGRLGPRAYAEATLWAMGAHLCVAVGLSGGAWALGLDPALPGVVFTYCAATAAVVVLFAVPGAQLGWDALFATLFAATCGVSLADAVLVVAMVRAQQLLLLLLGALSLAVLGGAPEPTAAT